MLRRGGRHARTVNAAALAAALADLEQRGEGLRCRSRGEIASRLGRVLDAWSVPGSPWQDRLCAELPGAANLHPATVAEGARCGFAPLTGVALAELLAEERDAVEARGHRVALGYATTAVVLAGLIPMPTLIATVIPLALGSPVLLKASRRDPVSPSLVAESIAREDGELGRCVRVVHCDRDDVAAWEALLGAECVVLNGSDAAIAAIAAIARRRSAARPTVAYGHRFSAALLGPGATSGDGLHRAARGLARDVALWDQLGCLSPVAVWVADPADRAADGVAEALAEALAEAQGRWPRGGVEPGEATVLAAARDTVELRAAAGAPVRMLSGRDGAWTVVREADPEHRPAPGHRFLRVHPARDAASWAAALRPHRRHLAGVALAGFGAGTPGVAELLAHLGASRLCAPGRLQAPPLAWRRDNRGVLDPLLRWCDLEAPVGPAATAV